MIMRSDVTRTEIVEKLKAHEDELRSRGVSRLWLFGSVARAEASEGSDLDVVIDIDPGAKFSIIDHGSLRVRLSEISGLETDVLVRRQLRPAFVERISRDVIDVF